MNRNGNRPRPRPYPPSPRASWAYANARRSTAARSRPAPCRNTADGTYASAFPWRTPPSDDRTHRGRPADAALRVPHAAGEPGRHDGRRRGGQRHRGHQPDRPAPAGRHPDGHPHARPGRDRGDRRIIRSGARTRILIVTTFDLDEYAYDGLRAGASGFLVKDALPEELLSGIRAVAAGDTVVAPSLTRRLLDAYARHLPVTPGTGGAPATSDPRITALTDREREILTVIGQGWSNTEIAARFHLAESTVKTQRHPHPRQNGLPGPRTGGHPGLRQPTGDTRIKERGGGRGKVL